MVACEIQVAILRLAPSVEADILKSQILRFCSAARHMWRVCESLFAQPGAEVECSSVYSAGDAIYLRVVVAADPSELKLLSEGISVASR